MLLKTLFCIQAVLQCIGLLQVFKNTYQIHNNFTIKTLKRNFSISLVVPHLYDDTAGLFVSLTIRIMDYSNTLKRTVEKTSTLVANMSTVNVLFWLAYTTVDFVLQKMLNYNATLVVDVCLHLCGV